MTRGHEEQVIQWLEKNKGKIILPHVGVLTQIERIGASNDNRKKADVILNGKAVSLKDVEGSFLYNKASRKDLLKFLSEKDIVILDNKIKKIHQEQIKRNVSWQEVLSRDRFKSLLKIVMMDMNMKQGISDYPAQLILTHPRKTEHIIDVCIYDFEEFFDIFADRWITFALKRHWPDQGDSSESNRAKRIMKDPQNLPWVFDGVSGNGPKSWSNDAPQPSERKTCFSCSIEIASPFKKWDQLRMFRLSLLNSGFFGVNSKILEKVTHNVYNQFGTLVSKQDDERWERVLTIANSVLLNNS